MPSRRLSIAACLSLAVGLAGAAHAATSNGVTAQKQWASMDKCARLAVDKFPDHTREEMAKRDEFIRKCQRDGHVPVRDGLVPKE